MGKRGYLMNLNNKSFGGRKRNNQNVDINSREYQTQVLVRSRGFFLTIVIFTIINLALILLNKGTQFLFSASIPYYLTLVCMGMDNPAGTWVIGQSTMVALGVTAIFVVAYLAFWYLSAGKPVWLNIGIVVFTLDTVALIYAAFKILESPTGAIVDLLVHVLIIWELSKGVTAAKNLANMPD